MGSGGCRKQAAAIMRDGRDRVRSIFSISREWSPYYSTARRPLEGSARLFDSRRTGRIYTLPLPFIFVPISLLSPFLCRSLSLSGWFVVGKNPIRGGASHGK